MIGVILAAGMGTRLMPLTKDIPKALLKINETTLLERMIKNCIFSLFPASAEQTTRLAQ